VISFVTVDCAPLGKSTQNLLKALRYDVVSAASGSEAIQIIGAIRQVVGLARGGQMDAFAAAADIVRMSDVDFEFLYGGGDHEGRAKALMTAAKSLFAVTRGTKERRRGTGQRVQ
jgi:hypothetical protein